MDRLLAQEKGNYVDFTDPDVEEIEPPPKNPPAITDVDNDIPDHNPNDVPTGMELDFFNPVYPDLGGRPRNRDTERQQPDKKRQKKGPRYGQFAHSKDKEKEQRYKDIRSKREQEREDDERRERGRKIRAPADKDEEKTNAP